MLKTERHDEICKLIQEQGTVTVSDVAGHLSVSEMTVRRDLEELATLNKLERVHGGARALGGKRGLTVPREFTHNEKRQLNRIAKMHIAKLACGLLNEGDTIFLGTGTTAEAMAGILPDSNLRVITNSLPVFNILDHRRSFSLCLVGGLYRPSTGAFVGPMAEDAASTIGIDMAFIGTNGVLGDSASTSNMEEGKLQQLVLDRADRRYLLADSSKLGRRDFYSFYDISRIDGIITDSLVSDEQLAELRERTTVLS